MPDYADHLGVHQFLSHRGSDLRVGLVVFGIAVLVGSGWRYRRYMAALDAGAPERLPGSAFGLAVTGVLAVAGVGLVVYLVVFG